MKKIKKININDLDNVSSFILSNSRDFEYFFSLGWSIDNIKNHFEKKNNFSIGYFVNNKLCSILIGETTDNIINFNLEIHILVVVSNIRRNKIGTKIINFVEKNKNLFKISKIYLEVSENNIPGIKFYEKNNFVFLNFRHNYYKENGNLINAKCYSKII